MSKLAGGKQMLCLNGYLTPARTQSLILYLPAKKITMPSARTLKRKEIRHLVDVSKKIKSKQPVSPTDIDVIIHLDTEDKKTPLQSILTKIALPGSIALGMTMAAFPAFYIRIVAALPAWTNMKPDMLNAVDYVWGILGKPVKQPNFIYHIPNIILYSFGVIGVKKLFEFVRRKTWLDQVNQAKETLEKQIEKGSVNYDLREHHSILFLGNGDFIGEEFVENSEKDNVISLATMKPVYTEHWIRYFISSSFETLNKALTLGDAYNAGEYILFPVKDTELFLPAEKEYDISPERVEVLIHMIRDIERMNKWEPKRIVIVGDRKQITCIRTETKSKVLDDTQEDVSLMSIDKDMRKVTIVDASDLVVKEIMRRYPERRILFRSSVEGSSTYKKRFFDRLDEMGYDDEKNYEKSVVVGYDLQEEQVARESFRTRTQEYLPIVLSKDLHDALLRNQYKPEQFIYVPDLVLASLESIAAAN